MGELVEKNWSGISEKVYIGKQLKVKERMTALKDLKAASGGRNREQEGVVLG